MRTETGFASDIRFKVPPSYYRDDKFQLMGELGSRTAKYDIIRRQRILPSLAERYGEASDVYILGSMFSDLAPYFDRIFQAQLIRGVTQGENAWEDAESDASHDLMVTTARLLNENSLTDFWRRNRETRYIFHLLTGLPTLRKPRDLELAVRKAEKLALRAYRKHLPVIFMYLGQFHINYENKTPRFPRILEADAMLMLPLSQADHREVTELTELSWRLVRNWFPNKNKSRIPPTGFIGKVAMVAGSEVLSSSAGGALVRKDFFIPVNQYKYHDRVRAFAELAGLSDDIGSAGEWLVNYILHEIGHQLSPLKTLLYEELETDLQATANAIWIVMQHGREYGFNPEMMIIYLAAEFSEMAMYPVNSQDLNNGYVLSSRYILDMLYSNGVITIGEGDSVKIDISDRAFQRLFQTIRFQHRELMIGSGAMKQKLADLIRQPVSDGIRRLDQLINKRLSSVPIIASAAG